jgi:H+/Cl- antiporter ClcA
VAVIFRALADKPVELVLFSGQTAIPTMLTQGSAAVVVGVIAAKAIAYGLSIAAGFRGGPVFPAVFLGVAVAVLATIAISDLSITAAVAAGVAAATACALRLPFTGVLLASLLVGSAGVDAIPLAIVGAVVGWVVAAVVEPPPAAEPQVQEGQPAQPQTHEGPPAQPQAQLRPGAEPQPEQGPTPDRA